MHCRSIISALSVIIALSGINLCRAEDSSSKTKNASSGFITYTLPNGNVYRVAAKKKSKPLNITQKLKRHAKGKKDQWISTSPDGNWFVLSTARFDKECKGWECLSIVNKKFSSGKAVRSEGNVVHAEGNSAVASSGKLIVYPAGDGTHTQDLWAISLTGGVNDWSAPVLLTADSDFEWNSMPAISNDGTKVVFDCGNEPYGANGTSICEVGTDGTEFRIVITPADSPEGYSDTGALHHPAYAPDGGIVFEGKWNDNEQIWRLSPGADVPELVNNDFTNDNSPCVLPDGKIASLWLNRPNSSGYHELKIMDSNGENFQMILINVDVADVGISCSQ